MAFFKLLSLPVPRTRDESARKSPGEGSSPPFGTTVAICCTCVIVGQATSKRSGGRISTRRWRSLQVFGSSPGEPFYSITPRCMSRLVRCSCLTRSGLSAEAPFIPILHQGPCVSLFFPPNYAIGERVLDPFLAPITAPGFAMSLSREPSCLRAVRVQQPWPSGCPGYSWRCVITSTLRLLLHVRPR